MLVRLVKPALFAEVELCCNSAAATQRGGEREARFSNAPDSDKETETKEIPIRTNFSKLGYEATTHTVSLSLQVSSMNLFEYLNNISNDLRSSFDCLTENIV